jgi:hypothetical protein
VAPTRRTARPDRRQPDTPEPWASALAWAGGEAFIPPG